MTPDDTSNRTFAWPLMNSARMTSDDLGWPRMASDDLGWPRMASDDLGWPLM
jgi:hypothetical protein